jgi:hypothetical protein
LALDEALWDCAGGLLECQCGKIGPGGQEFDVFAWQRTLVEGECSTKEKYKLWMNTVYNYTERQLTFWTDRFVALSGLAKQFLATSKEPEADEELKRPFKDLSLGTYLAGIWSSSLPLGLCCHAANNPGKRLSVEASRYIAPSWSWASVSGTINWDTNHDFQPRVQILSIRSDLAGPDEMGSVSGVRSAWKQKSFP